MSYTPPPSKEELEQLRRTNRSWKLALWWLRIRQAFERSIGKGE